MGDSPENLIEQVVREMKEVLAGTGKAVGNLIKGKSQQQVVKAIATIEQLELDNKRLGQEHREKMHALEMDRDRQKAEAVKMKAEAFASVVKVLKELQEVLGGGDIKMLAIRSLQQLEGLEEKCVEITSQERPLQAEQKSRFVIRVDNNITAEDLAALLNAISKLHELVEIETPRIEKITIGHEQDQPVTYGQEWR
jgi:hypothetical protein